MVTIHVWFIYFKYVRAWFLVKKKAYAYGLCSYIGFPNPTPIPVLYPNHTGMGPNIS